MAQNRLHLLGAWSAHGREEDAVSLFAGLENEYRGRAELLYARGCDFDGEDRSGFREAVAAAAGGEGRRGEERRASQGAAQEEKSLFHGYRFEVKPIRR